MTAKTNRDLVSFMLEMTDQAYQKKTWHGTTFRGSLRMVTPEMAAWRPNKNRHNIWEIMIHVAYYKRDLWKWLSGNQPEPFPYTAEGAWPDWFARPDHISDTAWKHDLALLKQYQTMFRETVAQLDPIRDAKKWAKVERYVIGNAYHDIYHTGQIQLLKRMWKEKHG